MSKMMVEAHAGRDKLAVFAEVPHELVAQTMSVHVCALR